MGLNEAALSLTLGIAAWTDWHERRIYNKLLGPSFLAALTIHFYQSGFNGLRVSLIGALIGFLLLLIPYFLGGIGAGDVKLLAVIGAFGTAQFVVTSFLYGAIIGGCISAAYLIRRKALIATLKNYFLFLPYISAKSLSENVKLAQQEKFPYGIAIVLGTIIAFYVPLGVW